jgi:hypothetical protein
MTGVWRSLQVEVQGKAARAGRTAGGQLSLDALAGKVEVEVFLDRSAHPATAFFTVGHCLSQLVARAELVQSVPR